MERLYTHGVLEDVEVLMECARDNIGDLTFQEQYDLTGMVFSVTVNSRREHGCARLLNYLTRSELSHSPHTHPFPPTPRRKYVAHVHVRVQTGYGNDLAATMKIPRAAICFVLFCACSPNVVIWSAVCASCAFTGLFEEVEVVCKDADGKICPWNPPGTKWSDGSMESDLHVNQQQNAIKKWVRVIFLIPFACLHVLRAHVGCDASYVQMSKRKRIGRHSCVNCCTALCAS